MFEHVCIRVVLNAVNLQVVVVTMVVGVAVRLQAFLDPAGVVPVICIWT